MTSSVEIFAKTYVYFFCVTGVRKFNFKGERLFWKTLKKKIKIKNKK